MTVEKVAFLSLAKLLHTTSESLTTLPSPSKPEVEQKVAPRSEVVDAPSGKKVGTVTTALGSRGLGLLRLDEAFKGSLTIRDLDDVKARAIKPEWWPADWLLDHQEQTVAA